MQNAATTATEATKRAEGCLHNIFEIALQLWITTLLSNGAVLVYMAIVDRSCS